MKREKEFDLVSFIRLLTGKNIPYMLIGRWAVILHGAPLMTADYDFWISSKSKLPLLKLLEQEGFELPPKSYWKRPILSVFAGPEKIDLLFHKKIVNRESQQLTFDGCLQRSAVKKDSTTKFSVRVPSIEDLIALKKIERKTAEQSAKDETDVQFLKAIQRGL